VGARQHADLGRDWPDAPAIAPVDPPPGLENVAAHDVAFEIMKERADLLGRYGVTGERFDRLRPDRIDLLVARLFLGLAVGFTQVDLELLAHFAGARADLRRSLRQRPWLLRTLLGEVDDRAYDRTRGVMAKRHGAQHDLLRKLLGFGLHHQHAFGRACNHE